MPQILELSLLALYRQNKKHVVLSPTALTLTVSLYSERCRCTLYGHTDSVNSIEFFPCSNILLTGSADKSLSAWDARTVSKSSTLFPILIGLVTLSNFSGIRYNL